MSFRIPVADLLGHAGHQPALDKVEQGAEQIQPQHEQQNLSDLRKVNAAGSLDLRHQTVCQLCGRLSQDIRANDAEHSGGNCTQDHDDYRSVILFHIHKQLAD